MGARLNTLTWHDEAGDYCPGCGMPSDHDGADEFGGGCDCFFAAKKAEPKPKAQGYSGGGMTVMVARKLEGRPISPDRQIADRLGIQVDTVRRWRAGDPKMRASTRERIEKTAREFGFLSIDSC
jgi:hypothetical protein